MSLLSSTENECFVHIMGNYEVKPSESLAVRWRPGRLIRTRSPLQSTWTLSGGRKEGSLDSRTNSLPCGLPRLQTHSSALRPAAAAAATDAAAAVLSLRVRIVVIM